MRTFPGGNSLLLPVGPRVCRGQSDRRQADRPYRRQADRPEASGRQLLRTRLVRLMLIRTLIVSGVACGVSPTLGVLRPLLRRGRQRQNQKERKDVDGSHSSSVSPGLASLNDTPILHLRASRVESLGSSAIRFCAGARNRPPGWFILATCLHLVSTHSATLSW